MTKSEKIKEYNRIYREKNKDKIREQRKRYREKNKLKIKEYNESYREDNKDEIKIKRKEYREKNKDKIKEYNKKYRSLNKDDIREQRRNYIKIKNNDPIFKCKTNIRLSILKSFKRNGFSKNSKTCDILGCSYEEFKLHLESQFEDWMTWENHGNPKDGILEEGKTWDIDHIIPLSTATCEEDIIKLNHYTNFQPLCSYVNRVVKQDNLW